MPQWKSFGIEKLAGSSGIDLNPMQSLECEWDGDPFFSGK